MTEPALEIEPMPDDMLRVSLTMHGFSAHCFVSSMHLVDEKRGQLKDSIMRQAMATYQSAITLSDW